MPSTFCLGDLHGRVELLKWMIQNHGDDSVVLAGDFLDSFKRSALDQVEALRLALDQCEKNPDWRILIANHELSYLFPDSGLRCSGYNFATKVLFDNELRARYMKVAKVYVLLKHKGGNPTLVTHAGLSSTFCAKVLGMFPDKDNLETLLDNLQYEFMNSRVSFLNNDLCSIGKYRGGSEECGGIFWCDYEDEFKAIPDINQVFGHSNVGKILITRSERLNSVTAAIDCLHKVHHYLEIGEDGSFEAHQMDF